MVHPCSQPLITRRVRSQRVCPALDRERAVLTGVQSRGFLSFASRVYLDSRKCRGSGIILVVS